MWAVAGRVEMGPLEQGWEKRLQVNTIPEEEQRFLLQPHSPHWCVCLIYSSSMAKISAVLTASGLCFVFFLPPPSPSSARAAALWQVPEFFTLNLSQGCGASPGR